jgi:hypothetical protein
MIFMTSTMICLIDEKLWNWVVPDGVYEWLYDDYLDGGLG